MLLNDVRQVKNRIM